MSQSESLSDVYGYTTDKTAEVDGKTILVRFGGTVRNKVRISRKMRRLNGRRQVKAGLTNLRKMINNTEQWHNFRTTRLDQLRGIRSRTITEQLVKARASLVEQALAEGKKPPKLHKVVLFEACTHPNRHDRRSMDAILKRANRPARSGTSGDADSSVTHPADSNKPVRYKRRPYRHR